MKSILLKATLLLLTIFSTQSWAGPISSAGGDPTAQPGVEIDSIFSAAMWPVACDINGLGNPPTFNISEGFPITISETQSGYLDQVLSKVIQTSDAFQVHHCASATDYISNDGLIFYSEDTSGFPTVRRDLHFYLTKDQLIGFNAGASFKAIRFKGALADIVLKDMLSKLNKPVEPDSHCMIITAVGSCSIDTAECTLVISPISKDVEAKPELSCPAHIPPPSPPKQH